MAVGALRIAVVGCGTAGPAAALLLSRAGHAVTLFERVPHPGPVGAGILLQPTGMEVMARLGLLAPVRDAGTVVTRLLGHTRSGRVVMDLDYGELAPGLFALGLHRGALFSALFGALAPAGVQVRCGVDICGYALEAGGAVCLQDGAGGRHGPFELLVVADGARSALRAQAGGRIHSKPYPWGALWFVGEVEDWPHPGTLAQRYHGTHTMIGFLPTGIRAGRRLVSLFYSVEARRAPEVLSEPVEAFRDEVLAHAPFAAPLLTQLQSMTQLTFAAYHDVRMASVRRGPVVFLGDAAHAMSPQLGQGANLALCDALALQEALAQPGALEPRLTAFEQARRAHNAWYQWASRWLTPFFQSRLAPLGWLRDGLMGPLCRVPVTRRLMLQSMAGVQRGLLPSSRRALPG